MEKLLVCKVGGCDYYGNEYEYKAARLNAGDRVIFKGKEETVKRMNEENDCQCDFENAVLVSRAKWLCPKCGQDFSLEYLFWAEAAHPEWFDEENEEGKQ